MITTVGAAPARVDVDVVCGEPVDFTVPVLSGGAAVDLTGWALAATAHVNRGETVLYSFTTAAASGEVTVTAAADDTADWTDWPPAARFTLWLTAPGEDPYLHAAGWVRTRTA